MFVSKLVCDDNKTYYLDPNKAREKLREELKDYLWLLDYDEIEDYSIEEMQELVSNSGFPVDFFIQEIGVIE